MPSGSWLLRPRSRPEPRNAEDAPVSTLEDTIGNQRRRAGVRRIAWLSGLILGLYLVGRGVAEIFVIDASDPATYRNDWGGPSLAGVLAVHCGPGLVAAVVMVIAAIRVRRSRHVRRQAKTLQRT
jgi:hypothetical protein